VTGVVPAACAWVLVLMVPASHRRCSKATLGVIAATF
jgi:hypothetical protein